MNSEEVSQRSKTSTVAAPMASSSVTASSCKLPARRVRRRMRKSDKQLQQLHGVLQEMVPSQVAQRRRVMCLEHLEKLASRWVVNEPRMTTNARNTISMNPWQQPRPVLVPFGSYRMQVYGENADLDVLLLAPACVSRDAFFSSFVECLKTDSSCTDVHAIPQAFTPVIKLRVFGVEVDLLFARMVNQAKLLASQRGRVSPLLMGHDSRASDGENNLFQELKQDQFYRIEDIDLQGQDEAGLRSLNGVRLSQLLLEMVPNVETFRSVLRIVKEWAYRQGLYSNVLGFLSGINCAILVAHVCMEHPDRTAAGTLSDFFATFCLWQWPQPVLLLELKEVPPPGVPALVAWNPTKYARDRLHLMPIITPAYPSMNSAYNVGLPQLRRIQDELHRAVKALKEQGPRGLLQPSTFFSRYEYFLQVCIRAANKDDYLLWFRLVESRLRVLMTALETPNIHVWPFCRFFQYSGNGRVSSNSRPEESLFFMGLCVSEGCTEADLHPLTLQFLHQVESWDERRPGMDVSISLLSRRNLPAFCLQNEQLEPAFALDESLSWSSCSSSDDFSSQTLSEYSKDVLPQAGRAVENCLQRFRIDDCTKATTQTTA